MFAARYNLGTVALAYERGETTSLAAITNKSNSFGVSFAAAKDITIGANYTKTDTDRVAANSSLGAATADEKIKSVSVGYNLGPIVVGLSYGEVDGYNGQTSNDGKAVRLDTNVRF
jgi:fructose-1,6-bisphosphatase